MAWIICPSGMSVKTSTLGDRSITYERLVKDIKDEKWSDHYRSQCIISLKEANFSSLLKDKLLTADLLTYLKQLANSTKDDSLKTSIAAVTSIDFSN